MIHPFASSLIAFAVAATAQAPPPEVEMQQVVQKLFLDLRNTAADDKTFVRFLTFDDKSAPERLATLQLLGEIRERLRPTTDAPMSELSPPLVFVRTVRIDSPTRATACAHIVRLGSLGSVPLGVYDVVAARVKEGWRLLSIKTAGPCQSVPDLVPAVPTHASGTTAVP